MANWERKSAYLLREIVKFRTYIDALSNAAQMKEKIYSEREGFSEKDAADEEACADRLMQTEEHTDATDLSGTEEDGGGRVDGEGDPCG